MLSAFVAAFLPFLRCGAVYVSYPTALSALRTVRQHLRHLRDHGGLLSAAVQERYTDVQLSSPDVLWGPTIWRRRCHRSAVGHGQEGAQLLQEWRFPRAGLPVHPRRQVVHRQPLFIALKKQMSFHAYVSLHPVWPTPQVSSSWLACGNANAGEHRAVVLRSPAFEAHTRSQKMYIVWSEM